MSKQDSIDELEKFTQDLIAPFSIHRAKYSRPHGTVARRQFANRTNKRLRILIQQEVNKAREIFVPIAEYGGDYSVSNTGKVYSNKNDRLLKLTPRTKGGYMVVSLCKNNVKRSMSVHRLVAMAFLPNPENKRTVNHKDSNKQNNHVDNLEWATHSENELHAHANGKVIWNKGTSVWENLTCLVCGRMFTSRAVENRMYCGNECKFKAFSVPKKLYAQLKEEHE